MAAVPSDRDQLLDAAQRGDAPSQHALAQLYAQEEEFGRARRWWEKAHRQGLDDATLALARLHRLGLGIAPDSDRALQILQDASARGSAKARYELGLMATTISAATMMDWERSADAGFVPAFTALALAALLEGDTERAQMQLDAGERAGDPFARKLALNPAIARSVQNSRLVEDAIGLYQHDHAFQPLECAWIRARAEPLLAPSQTIDPRTGKRVANPIRTSANATLHPLEEDIFLRAYRQRMLAIADTGKGRPEPLSILRYRPGQFYRPHCDFLPEPVETQRIATIIVYLNEVEAGGSTSFPRLNRCIDAQAGRAIRFRNVDDNGRPDPTSQHSGDEVHAGEKWVATLWVRA